MGEKATPAKTNSNVFNITYRYDFARDGGAAGTVIQTGVLIGSARSQQMAFLAIISTPTGVATSGAVLLDIGTTEDPNAFFALQAIVSLNDANPLAGVDLGALPYALRHQIGGTPNEILFTINAFDITSGIIDFNLLCYDLGAL